ncbi:MAG: indole-3-glycerol phosphate synthase TrpC [Pontiellaceae bacterium]|nr:indole-3-glycerol phosphate synthase TrpC [Pontiellaceae bacterium]
MNILKQICADKRIEIAARKQEQPVAALEALVPETAVRPDFVQALRHAPMGLIAEVKRRSPSAGAIREPFDPIAIARSYETHGAQAISCLMDHKYFGGGAADFSAVRGAVSLPMLYKEFVVDPWQIIHAKVMGASAVLLIVGVLADSDLTAFMEQIRSLGLAALVEVHDREEMNRAIDCGADCIGINNRNLKTFVTSLETTFELAALAPSAATLVSESGIKTPEDVVMVQKSGAHAVLVGESLLRESDPGYSAKCLMSNICV